VVRENWAVPSGAEVCKPETVEWTIAQARGLSGHTFAAKENTGFLQCFRFAKFQVDLATVGGLRGVHSRFQAGLLDEVAPALVAIG
jgi:hypothetical protein